MARSYEVRTVGDKLMIGRIIPDHPERTEYYMISARDLFAAIQAMDMMGVFARKSRPGHITQIHFTEDDIEAVDRRVETHERPEETTN